MCRRVKVSHRRIDRISLSVYESHRMSRDGFVPEGKERLEKGLGRQGSSVHRKGPMSLIREVLGRRTSGKGSRQSFRPKEVRKSRKEFTETESLLGDEFDNSINIKVNRDGRKV